MYDTCPTQYAHDLRGSILCMQGTQYAPRESILCMEHFVALQCLNLLIMHPATTYVILTISGLLLQEQIFTITLLPSVNRDWKELPVVVRQLDSVCSFKKLPQQRFYSSS